MWLCKGAQRSVRKPQKADLRGQLGSHRRGRGLNPCRAHHAKVPQTVRLMKRQPDVPQRSAGSVEPRCANLPLSEHSCPPQLSVKAGPSKLLARVPGTDARAAAGVTSAFDCRFNRLSQHRLQNTRPVFGTRASCAASKVAHRGQGPPRMATQDPRPALKGAHTLVRRTSTGAASWEKDSTIAEIPATSVLLPEVLQKPCHTTRLLVPLRRLK